MAMEIKNNMSATRLLNILNKNNDTLAKSLKRISSGVMITGASDDTSGYAISERMRVMLRGLNQDIRNTQNGSSMLRVAEGGMQNIVEELRSLKELALNAANDHNTDADRATIQKEFEHKIGNINDIADMTNYNGKLMLNGMYRNSEGHYNDKVIFDEPSGTPISILGGDYTIENDGVYTLGTGYSGTISISDGVRNVKLVQADNSTSLSGVHIIGGSGGGTNLWIEDLNISNTILPTTGSLIKFQGSDNVLLIKGNNRLSETSYTGKRNALIDIGEGLTIEGSDGILDINVNAVGDFINAPAIGTTKSNNQLANLVIADGNINIKVTAPLGSFAAGIGTGSIGKMGDILIKGGTVDVEMIVSSPSTHTLADTGAAIGSSTSGAVGNIVIGQGSTVRAISQSNASAGAGIGSGAFSGTEPFRGQAGDISISTKASVQARSISFTGHMGDDIGAGYGGTVGTVSYFTESDDSFSDTLPLVFHTGTKAGESINTYIEDMHTNAMGISRVSVTTQSEATSALDRIDSAIEYALDQVTSIGSIIKRLEYTQSNLTTAHENVTASESTLRDADMSKEMVEYTKNNVLLQATQSMLAQANQSASNVIGLLR